MPFTPSHIAAVLPFAKTPLLPAALAIGTMVPDLFYYVPVGIGRSFSHSWFGVFTIDLGVGILVFLLWQLVFRRPVVDFAPLWVRQRMGRSEWMPAGRLRWARLILVLAASVLIGCVTHVLWDSATHDGPFVHLVPVLFDQLGPLRLFKWLQHASSILGAIAIVLFVLWWRRRATVAEPAPTRLTTTTRIAGIAITLGSGLLVALFLWIRGMLGGDSPIDNELVFRVVVIGLAAAGLAAILVTVVWWTRRPKAE